jgi:hypothetical protein
MGRFQAEIKPILAADDDWMVLHQSQQFSPTIFKSSSNIIMPISINSGSSIGRELFVQATFSASR